MTDPSGAGASLSETVEEIASTIVETASIRVTQEQSGVLRITRTGDMTVSDAETFAKAMGPFMSVPMLRILADPRRAGKTPVEARRFYYELARRSPDARVAIVGGGPVQRVIVGLVLKITKRAKIEFFDDEAEASRWLGA